jgi:hypothetical protein
MKLTFLLLLVLTISCQETTKKTKQTDSHIEKLNLKQYFYNIDEYEIPKVLIYEVDSAGFKSKIYYVAQKISPNQLELTRYNRFFNKVSVLTDEYSKKGIKLAKSELFDNSDSTYESITIMDGHIFYFEPEKALGSLEVQTDVSKDSTEQFFRDLYEWKISDTTEIMIGTNKISTIISTGILSRDYTYNSETISQDIYFEIWYSEGIGISRQSYDFSFGKITETYLETISVQDFEELKNKGANKS